MGKRIERQRAVRSGKRTTRTCGELPPWAARCLPAASLALLLVAGAGGWAATAQLSGAVIATGTVNVDQNLKAVQHRDGGIISEIAVEEGDFVDEGEVLIRLDDVQTKAELAIVASQLAEATVRRARLLAERDGLDFAVARRGRRRARNHLTALIAGETRLFEGNLQQPRLAEGAAGARHRSSSAKRSTGSKRSAPPRSRRSSWSSVEHKKMKGLADKRLVEAPRSTPSTATWPAWPARRPRSTPRSPAPAPRSARSDCRSSPSTKRRAPRRSANCARSSPKIAELGERRIAIEDRLSRTDIRAPISGTINELAVNTIGGVITPAETLVTIVPKDAPLNDRGAAVARPTSIRSTSASTPSCASRPSISERRPSLQGRSPMLPPRDPRQGLRTVLLPGRDRGHRPTSCEARHQAAASRHAGRGFRPHRAADGAVLSLQAADRSVLPGVQGTVDRSAGGIGRQPS